VVNTVNFSNHAGYGRSGGSKATAEDLTEMFESLEANGLLNPSRLLTGYVPGAESLNAVRDFAQRLGDKIPGLIYLMDPVIGDGGKMYVAPDVVPVYRSMLPLATIITPNYFEVETLTNIKLEDLGSLQRALTILHHEYRVPNVVISSMPLQPWLVDKLPQSIRPTSYSDDGYLLCLCSSTVSIKESSGGISTVHAQFVPLLPGYFSGVGDLFSALLLGQFEKKDSLPRPGEGTPQTPLSYASSVALTKTHAVVTSTYQYSLTLPEEDRQPTDTEKDAADPSRRRRRMRGRELRLVTEDGQSVLRAALDNLAVRKMSPWLEFWTT